jgi:hypothetical protein
LVEFERTELFRLSLYPKFPNFQKAQAAQHAFSEPDTLTESFEYATIVTSSPHWQLAETRYMK